MTDRAKQKLTLAAFLSASIMNHSEHGVVDCTKVAEDLIENGVILPPVKIGDTIYVPRKDGFSAKKVEKIEICSVGTHIGFGWRSCGYEWVSASDVGKAFFLTPEDSERAQAESRGKNDAEIH